ncbi:unnamed protein product, partial [Tilletia controversa]
IGRSSFQKRS